MPYNSQLAQLKMPEYGRHVQYLVDYACTITDDVARNKLVNDIIELMGTINPTLRNVEDFRHKLWDHIFMISDFKLVADSPYPIPEREKLQRRNKKMNYPRQKIQFAHYGKNVETLVKKASAMEDPEMRQEFTAVIGNYMKLVYQNWNNDNVSDDIIITDIKFLSKGVLSLEDDSNLDNLSKSNARRNINSSSGNNNNSNNQNTGYRKNFQQNDNRNNNPNYRRNYQQNDNRNSNENRNSENKNFKRYNNNNNNDNRNPNENRNNENRNNENKNNNFKKNR